MQKELTEQIRKARLIMREAGIEANFSMSVAYLKYKEKTLKDPQGKAIQLLKEFEQQVIAHIALKCGMAGGLEEFLNVLDSQRDLRV